MHTVGTWELITIAVLVATPLLIGWGIEYLAKALKKRQ